MTKKSLTLDTTGCISINANASIDDLRHRGPTLNVTIVADKEHAKDLAKNIEHNVVAQLDTGANHSCISSKLAESLNATPVRDVLQHAAGQEVASTPAYKALIAFPTGTEITSEFAVLPSMHNDHDVLIGRDILSLCKLVVDFTTGQWSLHFKIK